jgi:predicted RND superfamily exporter protein
VLAIALAIAIAAGALASRLVLRSGLADLLQSNDPTAREFERIANALPGTLMMVIAIEGPDRDANRRAATLLAGELDGLRPRLVDTVIGDIRAERAFFSQRKWLYADRATLEQVRDGLRDSIARAKNPLLVEIDDSESPRALIDRLTKQRASIDRFPSGYFEGEAGHLVIVLVRPARAALGQDVGYELRDATLRILAAHPAIHASLGGSLIVSLEERAALMRDLARATLVCLVLVAVAVFCFFGRLRVVALFSVPALLGVSIGYAMAELEWGFVNMSAAFMGTIIVGNGINFAMVQQARYDELRRRGQPALEAAIAAVRSTAPATLVAALGGASAYGSLSLTRFRGFSQFGAVGATGMVAAWVATLVVLPAVWALFDHGSARRRFPSLFEARWLARAGGRPRLVLAIGGALAVLAAVAIPRYLADPFEYDLTKLRDRKTAAADVSARIEPIFGETVAPPIILAARRDQVAEIRAQLVARAGTPTGKELISAIRTIDDFLPGSEPEQRAKLAVLDQLRSLIDSPDLAEVDDPQTRRDLDELRPPESLRAVTIEDLPRTIRSAFTERDGTVGRIVEIFDHSKITAYDGHNQQRLTAMIGEVPLSDGTVARCPMLFPALIGGIAHDAPIATGLALLGVIVLVALFERTRGGTLFVIGTLLLGVTWMIGAAAWLGVKVNFLNFIALPITLGIGVDYGVNMYRRYVIEGAVGPAVRGIAGVLVLCSTTTIIGYGSLLAADNQALRSFGTMAILGEIATLLAAVTILPAALSVLDRRREHRRERRGG